ncbi:MAG TPA: fatty acid desaturase [Pyrinomonadaceae bacterium]|nr:fatty acid desaturase [Pyrinomonadaceae bacterium]HMP66979.1 fatty acid desaturase [Pyrinomonadaceae bacterium]
MKILAVSEEKNAKINWTTLGFVAVFHLFAIAAILTFSWANLAAGVIVWWVAGSLGIGLGYHRLLTHRGFKVPKWLEYTLTTFGALALQSGPLSWVTTHRVHHAFTETEKDPHSPRHGTYWSHIGWIFRGTAQNQTPATVKRYCPDLADDRFHQLLDRHYYVPTVVVGILLLAIGGWTMVLWGVFLRTVVGWHLTWLVNSATHLWGTRRFATRDDSRNNPLIAVFTFGEGWHNNHHAYPRSARHGLAWYEIDQNWIQIKLLEKLGLAKDVYAKTLVAEGPIEEPDTHELFPANETA